MLIIPRLFHYGRVRQKPFISRLEKHFQSPVQSPPRPRGQQVWALELSTTFANFTVLFTFTRIYKDLVNDHDQLAVVRIFADQTALKLREGWLIARVRRLLLWECVMKTLPLLWLLWCCWCWCCCVPMAAYLPPPTMAPTPAPVQQRLNSLSLPETGKQSSAQPRIESFHQTSAFLEIISLAQRLVWVWVEQFFVWKSVIF